MITTLLITAALVLGTATCVLFYCIVNAPDGHEAPDGFHFGEDTNSPIPVRRKPAHKTRKSRPAMAGGKLHLPAA